MSDSRIRRNATNTAYCLFKSNTIKRKNFVEYLRGRPTETLERMYNFPSVCMAVYRELPAIAKQFVMRILFIEQPVPKAVVSSWGSQHYSSEQLESTKMLTQLKIWRGAAIPGGLAAWELHPIYKKNLKMALSGGGKHWSIPYTVGKDTKSRDTAFLDKYAMNRWRCVLHYMVGSSGLTIGEDSEVISPEAVRILLYANLMKRDEIGITITRHGFQFLLLDTEAQVWYFMQQYLDTCEERGFSFSETLNLLIQLSFSTLGRDYNSNGLNIKMLTVLQHLREFGLVYQRKRKEGRFQPTRLVINITCKMSCNVAVAGKTGDELQNAAVLVETNHRVYAYTDSPLQVAILGLFTELIYRFPNLVIGLLTRNSVRQALRGGITAEQIISYLQQYSHPITKKEFTLKSRKSPLPLTVIDQIKLWEEERKRFSFIDGIIYNQFLSQADFNTLRNYALSINALVWHSDRIRAMVVTENGHEDVKRYWKLYSKMGQ